MCTKSFPLYDEMLALVEGRHATGGNVFHVTPTTSGSRVTKSDEEHEDKRDGHNIKHGGRSIKCDNSFETNGEGSESVEPFFKDDWVRHPISFTQ